MDNIIRNTEQRLQEAYSLLIKYVETRSLLFDEKKEILEIYRSVKDTNAIIKYAEQVARENVEGLYADALMLAQTAQAIIKLFDNAPHIIESFDTKQDCELYLKRFEEARDVVVKEAQKVTQELIPLDHRLDNWEYQNGYDDQEGKEALEAVCDTLKAKHKELSEEIERLDNVWREQVKQVSGLLYFDISMLQIIVVRISRIAVAIVTDIDNLKKEGQL